MKILKSISELSEWRKACSGSVGFVPTMGALHAGHSALMKASVQQCDHSIASIFVNPKQFGLTEDLGSYPRTWDQDQKLLKEVGVSAVFFPSTDEIYPPGFSTYVEETALSIPLCGSTRPGHFRGVTTVVLKLINLVQPTHSFFGLKDSQQYLVIKKMVSDLNVPTVVIPVETQREHDGLAMSSRNVYLTPDEREVAPMLYRKLKISADQIKRGDPVQSVLDASVDALTNAGFRVQYFELRDSESLAVVGSLPSEGTCLLAVAAYLGKTRLIDNVMI